MCLCLLEIADVRQEMAHHQDDVCHMVKLPHQCFEVILCAGYALDDFLDGPPDLGFVLVLE
jgi:hypothetical protein